MTLIELRKTYGITQKEAALSTGVPLRTYIRYEKNDDQSNLKYIKMIELLKEKYDVNEEKGILALDYVISSVTNVFSEYKDAISFCYLFGSYAKGYAKEKSDVDLCINTTLTGLKFVGLVEKLHQALKKNVDVIRFQELSTNQELLNEIKKDGIKI